MRNPTPPNISDLIDLVTTTGLFTGTKSKTKAKKKKKKTRTKSKRRKNSEAWISARAIRFRRGADGNYLLDVAT